VRGKQIGWEENGWWELEEQGWWLFFPFRSFDYLFYKMVLAPMLVAGRYSKTAGLPKDDYVFTLAPDWRCPSQFLSAVNAG
jgi:hypothetical protein